MTYPADINKELLQQWVVDKLDPQEVEKVLMEKGIATGDISEFVKAYKKLKNENRQFIGFICAGLGAFLVFISCVLSIVNPILNRNKWPLMYSWQPSDPSVLS